MAKLDARNWMEFRIGDIFRMNNTKSIVQKDVVPDSGTVPYVTAQAGNNGVMTFIDCPPEWMDEGDCIMIGGKTLTFSYQEKAFCSNDSHNIALHLKETDKASEARYLFLIRECQDFCVWGGYSRGSPTRLPFVVRPAWAISTG